MTIIFDKSELLAHLSPAMGCISTKSTFTSIEGVYIEGREDNRCVLCTYDMEKGMRTEFDCEVIEAEGGRLVLQYAGTRFPIVVSRDVKRQPCPLCGEVNDKSLAECRGCGLGIVKNSMGDINVWTEH